MTQQNKCDSCGKFCALGDLVGCEADDGAGGSVTYTECVRCTSESELKRLGKASK